MTCTLEFPSTQSKYGTFYVMKYRPPKTCPRICTLCTRREHQLTPPFAYEINNRNLERSSVLTRPPVSLTDILSHINDHSGDSNTQMR